MSIVNSIDVLIQYVQTDDGRWDTSGSYLTHHEEDADRLKLELQNIVLKTATEAALRKLNGEVSVEEETLGRLYKQLALALAIGGRMESRGFYHDQQGEPRGVG